MKRYTLRGLIHDAKIFNQLRLEHRRTKKDRRKNAFSDGLSHTSKAITLEALPAANLSQRA
jgi:hypothetical protein